MVQVGVDIGGTSVKAVVVTDGKVVRTGQSGFYTKPTAPELRTAIAGAVGPVRHIDAVGICAPGLLDSERRVITFAINVPGIVGTPLDSLVPSSLGLPDRPATVIANDGTAAAFDLFRTRNLRGRLLVLTLGTWVGNAVLDDGKLLNMGGGASGHVGQMDVSLPGPVPIGPDGGAGGLEAYVGVAALRAAYGEALSEHLSRLSVGEPAVQALVRAIRICHAIYRPNHFVLCGGVGIRLKHLLAEIRTCVEDKLTNLARPAWTLACGDDDFHAARGAAIMSA